MPSEGATPAAEKLRSVLDYLPCEACLATPTADQETLCSICRRLDRQISVKLIHRREILIERPLPPAPVLVPAQAARPVEIAPAQTPAEAAREPLALEAPPAQTPQPPPEPKPEPAAPSLGPLPLETILRVRGLFPRPEPREGRALEIVVEPFEEPHAAVAPPPAPGPEPDGNGATAADGAAQTPEEAPVRPGLEVLLKMGRFARLRSEADRVVVTAPYEEPAPPPALPAAPSAPVAAAATADEDSWDDVASVSAKAETDDDDIVSVAERGRAAAPRDADDDFGVAESRPTSMRQGPGDDSDDLVGMAPGRAREGTARADVPDDDFVFRPPDPVEADVPLAAPAPDPDEQWMPDEEVTLEAFGDDPNPWAPPPPEAVPPETTPWSEGEDVVEMEILADDGPVDAPPADTAFDVEEVLDLELVEEEVPAEANEFTLPEPQPEPRAALPPAKPAREVELHIPPKTDPAPAAAPSPEASNLWRLKGFTTHAESALLSAGITDVSHLAGRDVDELAARTGLSAGSLTPWTYAADLHIEAGVPLDAAVALVAAGIAGTHGLGEMDAEDVVERVNALGGGPNVTDREVRRWKRRV